MTSQPRTAVRLAVALVTAMIATFLSQPPASAAAYTITISTGATSGVSGGGNPLTYTPSAPDAVLNVTELESALAGGAVVVGSPGTTSGVLLAADITSPSANDLTLDVAASLGADVTASLGSGNLTFTSSLDGAHALSVNGTGRLAVAGPVGATVGLSSLSADVASITTGSLTVIGNLALTTNNTAITQSGAWIVGGSSTIDAGTSSITLTNAGNDFTRAVSLAGGTTQVTDQNALTLGRVDVGSFVAVSTGVLGAGSGVVAGDLNLASNQGAITQSGALAVGGTSMIDAGDGAITLTNAGNDFAGAVSLTGKATQVTDQNALTLGTVDVGSFVAVSGDVLTLNGDWLVAGGLALRSSGHMIVQMAGTVTVSGTSDIDAGSGAVLLASVNDFGGAVSLTGATTQLSDQDALTLGKVDVGSLAAVAGGILMLNGDLLVADSLALLSSGYMIVQTAGTVTVSGTSDIDAGSASITLANAANDFVGRVALTGGATDVTDANQLVLWTTGVTDLHALAGGTLNVLPGSNLTATGAMVLASDRAASGTGRLKLGDAASLTAGGPIALYAADQDRVDLGTGVTLNGASYVPGDRYVNTEREQWGVTYPSGTPVSPFTFFFRDLGTQVLTFTSTPPSPALVGGSYTPVATSTATLPVTLTIDPGSVGACSIDGSGTVRFLAPGTCLIDADQGGDATHAGAAQVQQSVAVVAAARPPAPGFAGPVTGVDSASSNDPEGSPTARQGCVTATGHGAGSIVAATYAADPVGPADFRATGPWFDVQVPEGSAFSSVDVTCSPDGRLMGANSMYWWDGMRWRLVTGQHYDPVSGTTSASLTGSSSPAVADLTGTVFAMGTRPLVSRLAGADRVQTAIEVSGRAYRDGTAGAVVLAADDTYADALVGGPLAVAEGGPLLLTPSGRVSSAVENELRRVLPTGGTVYLLGGDAALSSKVERQVEALGLVVRRLGGANRYETAVRVAHRLPHPQHVFLATGTDFPDALSAGAAAAHAGGAVLLTAGTSLPTATRRWLARHSTLPRTAIGGPAASAAPDASRVVGSDRYATASLVAEQMFDDPAAVGIASGEAFADALSAVSLLGPLGAPLLLTRPWQLPAPTRAWLAGQRATLVDVAVVGGPSAVTGATRDDVVAAVGGIG